MSWNNEVSTGGMGGGVCFDKESTSTSQATTSQASVGQESRVILDTSSRYGKPGYPFPLILRLRVLQIVCGISGVVMGAVACIEERKTFNLGLAVPTGAATILAAALSIYCSRGFGGYRPRPQRRGGGTSYYRLLGPAVTAIPLFLLWSTACSLHIALLFLTYRTLAAISSSPNSSNRTAKQIKAIDDYETMTESDNTLEALSFIFIFLSSVTLCALLFILKIEWSYDPD